MWGRNRDVRLGVGNTCFQAAAELTPAADLRVLTSAPEVRWVSRIQQLA
jgi:hypothetical protein